MLKHGLRILCYEGVHLAVSRGCVSDRGGGKGWWILGGDVVVDDDEASSLGSLTFAFLPRQTEAVNTLARDSPRLPQDCENDCSFCVHGKICVRVFLNMC